MMKKNYCLLSLLLLCAFTGHSQNNLQFNQVITHSGTLTTTAAAGDSTATWTVPTGKVWKIESLSGNAYNYTNSPVYLLLNDTRILDVYNAQTKQVFLPIWLKAGDAIRFAEYSSSNNFYATYFISMVEFNLTPL